MFPMTKIGAIRGPTQKYRFDRNWGQGVVEELKRYFGSAGRPFSGRVGTQGWEGVQVNIASWPGVRQATSDKLAQEAQEALC